MVRHKDHIHSHFHHAPSDEDSKEDCIKDGCISKGDCMSHSNFECRKKYTGVFVGSILVILGVLLLLNVLGLFKFSIWSGLATYWPIGLILIGIAIILRLRWFTIAFMIITVILCTAFLADTLRLNHIQGSGMTASKTFDVQKFNGVQLKMPAQVHLSQGVAADAPNVTVVADDNILDVIDAHVVNGVLVLEYKDNYKFWSVWPDSGIEIYVTTPDISSVRIDGAGSITQSGNNPIVSDNMEILVNGAGDIDMNVIANNLDSRISGFGDIHLTGLAKNYSATISGAGDINAYDLAADSAKIKISGSGSVDTQVINTLNVDISGAGDVHYKGSPVLTEHISGAGNVEKVE